MKKSCLLVAVYFIIATVFVSVGSLQAASIHCEETADGEIPTYMELISGSGLSFGFNLGANIVVGKVTK